MSYLSKNIDGLVYSEDFGGWIDDQEMHIANEEYEKCSELVEIKKFIEFDKFIHKLGVNNGVTNI